VVPAAELHAEALITEGSGEADGEGEDLEPNGDSDVNMRTNRETVDDVSSHKLTLAEIEALKKEST
jgi:tRNA (adenine-N(1)-)-methyltransferase non-catalytic subunit